jgi:signal transduction histidine kinase
LRRYLQTHPEAGLKVMNALASLVADRYRTSINTLTYFLSIVSHELRSPLAAIENYLNTMLGGFAGELTSKQQRMIQRSVLRVADLRALIGDVVDLARMRPEQIQADFEWFDPGEVGTESLEDARLPGAEKGVRIKVEPPPKFEPIVGARRRMRQVFTNLLNNAIKFAPPDTVVYFRAHYEPDKLVFEIEDEGPGIPAVDLPHLFKDFFRASNVGDQPGMGLGLSIAHKIIEAHNGQIQVKSPLREDGIGTRLTVHIPRDLKTPEMKRQEWKDEG